MKQERRVYAAEERPIIKEYRGGGYGYEAQYKKFVTARSNGEKPWALRGAKI